MSDVTLKIDADTAAYISKIAKMAEAHKASTDHLGKQVQFSDQLTHGIARSLLKAIALKEIAESVADAFLKASRSAAELGAKMGQGEERTASNLATIGFTGENLEGARAVVGQQGGRISEAQRNSFVARFAAEQRRRREKFLPELTQRQFYESFNSYRQGGDLAYGEGGEEIFDTFTNARYAYGINADMNARTNDIAARRLGVPAGPNALGRGLANAPTDLLDEGTVTEYQRAGERQRYEKTRSLGVKARMQEERRKQYYVDSPFLMWMQDVMERIPVSGKMNEASLEKIGEHARRQEVLQNRRVLRQDNPHDEGKP